jgi:hypothetical protein
LRADAQAKPDQPAMNDRETALPTSTRDALGGLLCKEKPTSVTSCNDLEKETLMACR